MKVSPPTRVDFVYVTCYLNASYDYEYNAHMHAKLSLMWSRIIWFTLITFSCSLETGKFFLDYRRRLAALDPSSRGNSHAIFRMVLTQVNRQIFPILPILLDSAIFIENTSEMYFCRDQ